MVMRLLFMWCSGAMLVLFGGSRYIHDTYDLKQDITWTYLWMSIISGILALLPIWK